MTCNLTNKNSIFCDNVILLNKGNIHILRNQEEEEGVDGDTVDALLRIGRRKAEGIALMVTYSKMLFVKL